MARVMNDNKGVEHGSIRHSQKIETILIHACSAVISCTHTPTPPAPTSMCKRLSTRSIKYQDYRTLPCRGWNSAYLLCSEIHNKICVVDSKTLYRPTFSTLKITGIDKEINRIDDGSGISRILSVPIITTHAEFELMCKLEQFLLPSYALI